MRDLGWDKDFNPLAKVNSGRVGVLLEVEWSPTVDCIWQSGLHDPDWAESHAACTEKQLEVKTGSKNTVLNFILPPLREGHSRSEAWNQPVTSSSPLFLDKEKKKAKQSAPVHGRLNWWQLLISMFSPPPKLLLLSLLNKARMMFWVASLHAEMISCGSYRSCWDGLSPEGKSEFALFVEGASWWDLQQRGDGRGGIG